MTMEEISGYIILLLGLVAIAVLAHYMIQHTK